MIFVHCIMSLHNFLDIRPSPPKKMKTTEERRDLQKQYEKETRGAVGWACVAHLSFCFEETYYRTFHRCFPPSFGSFGKAVSDKKIFRNRPIWNKNCLRRPCLLTNHDEMTNLHREPSIDASYQVSVHFVKQFQRRRFL